ncbi:MAG: ADP-ribosylglycohydrolase family protein [Ruminococcus sp.]|nr:ADP-ribosylglycohydrolase family protein [Candidatus Apopatosoma intestinale]
MYKNTDERQPDTLSEILSLRPEEAKAVTAKPVENLYDRMKGAVVGRCAGCTLGVPVEMWPVLSMIDWAMRTGTPFPPTDYWERPSRPEDLQYRVSPRKKYTKMAMVDVPVDDDITYMILNLLLLEKYGKGYTVDDVGRFWLDVLPYACTAEDEALHQLQYGTKPEHAAEFNSYVEWIGAAIRADAFGYACAGDPEQAAKLAYADAYLTHRKNGIYGEMFCAASIAAAFTADSPLDAVKIGATMIPAESELRQALQWAFSMEGEFETYAKARALIDEHFKGMSAVHTINNMCCIVFGLMLGGKDFTACLANTVAIGYDNDCTGATVGSIVGANLGFDRIPEHWYRNFNDTIETYIKDVPTISIEDTVRRFIKLNG